MKRIYWANATTGKYLPADTDKDASPSIIHALNSEYWWWYRACKCRRQNATQGIPMEEVFDELGRGAILNQLEDGRYTWLQLRSKKDKKKRYHRNLGF